VTVRSAVLPRSFALRRPTRVPRLPRFAGRALAVLLVLAVALGGGWLWLRDSPVVSVDHVRVTGVHGPDAAGIRDVLTRTATSMTTLDVNTATLRSAVMPYTAVSGIAIQSHPPHNLTIVVRMNVAVAALVSASRPIAVSADGTLLNGLSVAHVPTIHTGAPPAGRAVTVPALRAEVAVAAAAPAPLRSHIVDIWRGPRGLSARLRNGPDLYFGSALRLTAKWAAISRVLADPTSAGATYLDATVPERVGAGGLEPTITLDQ
jgi:cell division protein FtsQ